MTRAFRNAAAFLVGFLLMISAGMAFAEGTVPATSETISPVVGTGPAAFNGCAAYATGSYPLSTACTNWADGSVILTKDESKSRAESLIGSVGCAFTLELTSDWTYDGSISMRKRWQCKNGATVVGYVQGWISTKYYRCPDGGEFVTPETCTGANICPSGYQWNATRTACDAVAACPANSTGPVNGLCTCDLTFVATGSSCVAAVCDMEAANAAAAGNEYNDPANSGAATNGCFSGCLMTPASTTTTSDGKVWTYFGPASGATCAEGPSTAPAGTTEHECMQKGSGYSTINGVTVCAPPVATTENKETTTTPGDGGPPVTTTEQKSTACEGGECTQTKTGPDGTATTTKQSQGAFCEENPNSPFCKGLSDPCVETPDRLGCAELGEVADPGELTTQPRGAESITPVAVASIAGCPADVALPKGLVFSYSGACEFADGVRPVVLAMAWLIAGLIVFGFKSE